MKQALTAGGLISVWFESAKIALEKLEVDFEENLDLPQLTGVHPEYGEITIDFFVPVQDKTRMEITVQDAAMIAAFKKNVVPAFKYVSALAAQQSDSEPEPESVSETDAAAEQDPRDDESKDEDQVPDQKAQTEGAQDSPLPGDASDDDTETQSAFVKTEDSKAITSPAEVKASVRHCKYCHAVLQDGAKVCPECGKKQKSKGPLIAGIIIGILILLGAAGFAAYKLTGGQNFSFAKIKTILFGGSSVTETTDSSLIITIDQFNQTQKGMTYEEVCKIMGSKGTFLEPETQLIYSDGSVITLKTYYWNAQGADGANVCVTFRNGVVAVISQSGLQ